MNTEHNNTNPHDHGTTRSYVRGFLLSLIFTFIPYILVVEKLITGNALLATILGFAVIQMIIQIVFFLHLGREKGPRWQLLFFVSTVGIILVVVAGSVFIMNNLHYNMSPVTREDASKQLVEKEGIYQIGGTKTGACEGQHATHKVVMQGDLVTPKYITAKTCDKLTFINDDEAVSKITFAPYPDLGVYAGESELLVRKGRAKTIILAEPGTYQFHNRANPEAVGGFTVQ